MRTPLSPKDRAALWIRLAIRFSLTVFCVIATLTLGPHLISLLAPFLLALVVAWALHSPVLFLQKKLGFSRNTVSLVLLLLCCVAVGGTLYGLCRVVFAQVRALAADWTTIRQSFLDLMSSFSVMLSSLSSRLHLPLTDMADNI